MASSNLTYPADEAAAETSSVDFFTPELVEKSIVSRKNCVVRPHAISEAGPMQIFIPPEGDYFIDPASFRVHADFCVKKRNAAGALVNLEDGDSVKVAPINMFTKSLFKSIETSIQQKNISLVATAAYPYKAFLETCCNYGLDAENGHLRCSYWLKDEAGKQDTPDENDAFEERHDFIKNSRTVRMVDNLHTEVTTLTRLLPPGLDITFEFQMNDVNTFIQTAPPAPAVPPAPQLQVDIYAIEMKQFYLAFDRVTINPKLLLNFETRMSKMEKAVFPISRGIMRSKQIPAAERNVLWQNLYSGTLPETILICMVDSATFNGAAQKNLFNLQHFNMESICLRVNSVAVPASPIETFFGENEAIRAYEHFFNNIGIEKSNAPTLVTYNDFLAGSTIFPFDLTPDKCALEHNHTKQKGIIELDIKFANALNQGITILAMCSFTDKFYITGPQINRQVILNPQLMV